jgi:hypothetical protein
MGAPEEGGRIELPQFSAEQIMESLLAADSSRDRVEPKVAQAIGEQLLHMDLETPSLSVRRRIRDIVARLEPRHIVEVGAGIGHLSAWLFHHWSDEKQDTTAPIRYSIVEAGGRFGVILQRLVSRYEAQDWSEVLVRNWDELIPEIRAWQAANASAAALVAESSAPLPLPIDLLIIHSGWDGLADTVRSGIPLLSENGLLLAIEPAPPDGDVGAVAAGAEPSIDQRRAVEFNKWIQLVTEVHQTNLCSFLSLYGGTLFALRA